MTLSSTRRAMISVARSARQIGWPTVARRPFVTPDAHIVVSTDGYFDVFAPITRTPNDKPSYRGAIGELGATVRSPLGRLSVRPDSVALDDAVSAWSGVHGAAAVRGELGTSREDFDAAALESAEAVLATAR